jgi:hypothetical protein
LVLKIFFNICAVDFLAVNGRGNIAARVLGARACERGQ